MTSSAKLQLDWARLKFKFPAPLKLAKCIEKIGRHPNLRDDMGS